MKIVIDEENIEENLGATRSKDCDPVFRKNLTWVEMSYDTALSHSVKADKVQIPQLWSSVTQNHTAPVLLMILLTFVSADVESNRPG